ncbi:hypothetical protein SALBM311S_05885 [Streptomyces alboniger]
MINTYRSRDDEWITVTSATLRSVRNIARLLGLEEERFATARQQHAGRAELDDGLRAWVAERPAAECAGGVRRRGQWWPHGCSASRTSRTTSV